LARTLANIKKARYKVMTRAAAAFTTPADAAAFSTLLGTFTDLGYCEDKEVKLAINKGEEITVDDGSKKLLAYSAVLEGKLLQTESADFTAVAAIEGTSQDVLLYDSVTMRCIFVPTIILYFEESFVTGEVQNIPFKGEREDVSTKAELRTIFDEPES
jgi:hypothetical protein